MIRQIEQQRMHLKAQYDTEENLGKKLGTAFLQIADQCDRLSKTNVNAMVIERYKPLMSRFDEARTSHKPSLITAPTVLLQAGTVKTYSYT